MDIRAKHAGASDEVTTIYCSQALRNLWPSPLAQQWHDQYPGLFDSDDIRLSDTQPVNHFAEWFAAVHLFQRDGSISLMEKYVYPSHSFKSARYRSVLSEDQWLELESIRKWGSSKEKVQLPDLFVMAPDHTSFSFAEVKGPGDRLSQNQIESHAAIRTRLGVSVEIIKVVLVDLSELESTSQSFDSDSA